MAQILDADFFLDGHGMILGSVAIFCLDLFPVWVITQYFMELINWSEFIAYLSWRQWMIHQGFVQVEIDFLQNIVVDDGCGV